MNEQHAFSGQLCGGIHMHDAHDAGVTKLELAAQTARDFAPLPEFTDALLALLGKAAIGLVSGPISDQSELLLTIAKLARRNK
jgi:hypothetical protein